MKKDDSIIVGMREGTDDQRPTLWVCVRCKVSAESSIQPRCTNCKQLMIRATK
jgi:ABC-type ATPase with predicted acetyltransferase domain